MAFAEAAYVGGVYFVYCVKFSLLKDSDIEILIRYYCSVPEVETGLQSCIWLQGLYIDLVWHTVGVCFGCPLRSLLQLLSLKVK